MNRISWSLPVAPAEGAGGGVPGPAGVYYRVGLDSTSPAPALPPCMSGSGTELSRAGRRITISHSPTELGTAQG